MYYNLFGNTYHRDCFQSTEMISGIFKSASPVNNAKNHVNLPLDKKNQEVGEGLEHMPGGWGRVQVEKLAGYTILNVNGRREAESDQHNL